MEGKVVIMSVVLVSLVVVLGQIDQVEAAVCCPSMGARFSFSVCSTASFGMSDAVCAAAAGCSVSSGSCPPGWTNNMLQNMSVNEYCKLGCVSSVCAAISTLQNSDASAAVEKCTNACSDFCTKGSVKTA